MALYVGDKTVLSHPEFIELMQELPLDYSHPVLEDLFFGEADPAELEVALDVSVRLAAGTDHASEIIDRALARLAT